MVKEQEVEKGCISSLGWKMMEASKWPNCFRNTFIFRLYSFDKEVPDISEIFDIFWEDRVWAPRQLLLLLWYHRYSLATLAQKELSSGLASSNKKESLPAVMTRDIFSSYCPLIIIVLWATLSVYLLESTML